MKRRTGNFEHYAKLVLRLFLSYIIFSLVQVFIYTYAIGEGEGSAEQIGWMILFSLFLYAPLNTFVLLLIYILKINKFILFSIWYIFIESIIYVILSLFVLWRDTFNFLSNFIPKETLFLAPYIIIIPIFALQGYYIKRKRKRKELAATPPTINPDNTPQSKQTDH